MNRSNFAQRRHTSEHLKMCVQCFKIYVNCSNIQQKALIGKKRGCFIHGFKEQCHRINWYQQSYLQLQRHSVVFYLFFCFTLYKHYFHFTISSTFLMPTTRHSTATVLFLDAHKGNNLNQYHMFNSNKVYQ